jgi:crotonobetainyl-CoA:carnitine CoA-transferase CaiB-like acyl-CoA transferase
LLQPAGHPGTADAASLDEAIAEWAIGRTSDDIVSACQAAGVPASPVLELDAVVKQAHLRAREMLVEVPGPAGDAWMFGSPFKLSRTPGRVVSLAEPVGASTAALMAELRPSATNKPQ